MASSTFSILLNGTQTGTNSNTTTADNLTNFSVSTWIKYNDTQDGNLPCIIAKQDHLPGTPPSWNLYSDNDPAAGVQDRVFFRIAGTGQAIARTSAPLNDNAWHNVVATWDGSTIHLYVDGSDVTTLFTNTLSSGFSNAAPISIGNVATPSGLSEWVGNIDDTRIWNITLTSGDASTIASGGDPSTPAIAYWQMEEGSGSVLNDATGNGNVITFDNPPTWTTDVPPPLVPTVSLSSMFLVF